jgi:hypothetical protein
VPINFRVVFRQTQRAVITTKYFNVLNKINLTPFCCNEIFLRVFLFLTDHGNIRGPRIYVLGWEGQSNISGKLIRNYCLWIQLIKVRKLDQHCLIRSKGFAKGLSFAA